MRGRDPKGERGEARRKERGQRRRWEKKNHREKWEQYFKTDFKRLHGLAVQTNNQRLVGSKPISTICLQSLSFASCEMGSNTLHSAMKKDWDMISRMWWFHETFLPSQECHESCQIVLPDLNWDGEIIILQTSGEGGCGSQISLRLPLVWEAIGVGLTGLPLPGDWMEGRWSLGLSSRTWEDALGQFGVLEIIKGPKELLFTCITLIDIYHIRNSNWEHFKTTEYTLHQPSERWHHQTLCRCWRTPLYTSEGMGVERQITS